MPEDFPSWFTAARRVKKLRQTGKEIERLPHGGAR